jgi:hypothetical protein
MSLSFARHSDRWGGTKAVQGKIILKNLFRWDFEAKHPTLNNQHPTPNAKTGC